MNSPIKKATQCITLAHSDIEYEQLLVKLGINPESAFERIEKVTAIETNQANRDVDQIAREFGISIEDAFKLYIPYINQYIKAKTFIQTIA